jgi:hypothetical protein
MTNCPKCNHDEFLHRRLKVHIAGNHKTEEFVHPVRCIEKGRGCTEPQLIQ